MLTWKCLFPHKVLPDLVPAPFGWKTERELWIRFQCNYIRTEKGLLLYYTLLPKKKTPVTSFSQNGQTYAQWSAVVAQNLILTPYCEQETSSNRIAVSGRRGRGAQLEKERCIYIFLARMYPKFYMESFYAQQIIVFITNNSTCVFPGPIVRFSYQAMSNLTSDITMWGCCHRHNKVSEQKPKITTDTHRKQTTILTCEQILRL